MPVKSRPPSALQIAQAQTLCIFLQGRERYVIDEAACRQLRYLFGMSKSQTDTALGLLAEEGLIELNGSKGYVAASAIARPTILAEPATLTVEVQ